MGKVVTYGCCTNARNVYYANILRLVLDTPTYNNAQLITSIPLPSFITISRVNKVVEKEDGLLIVHIA